MLRKFLRRTAYLILSAIDKLPAPKPAPGTAMTCPFCSIPPDKYLASNDYFYALPDHRPVSRGHSLVISKRHVETYFELSPEEAAALNALVSEIKTILDQRHKPKGYKLLMNCGASAGQRVFHFHLHVLPHY